jgi:hypothetical protein
MSKNIYDLFNARKNGLDCLVEGYDFNIDESMEFENLDVAAEALEQITVESTNEMLELRAAWYLEDLVIENMMYEDFDEEKISHVMEAAKGEKKEGLVQKIKGLWERIKQWFATAFRAIANHFQSGENLVAKYRKDIPVAMRQSKGKVKMREVRDFGECVKVISNKVEALKAVGQSKDQILASINVSDAKGVSAMVEKVYFLGDAKEIEIKKMNPQKVMDWAANKKIYLDALKKEQKDTDGKFKEILAEIKKGGEGKEGDEATKAAEKAANFQFGIGLLNAMLGAEIRCVKNISNACTAVIKKALAKNYDPNYTNKAAETQDEKNAKAFKDKAGKVFGKEKGEQMARPQLNSWEVLGEDWEILEDSEDNDDFEW